MPNKNYLRGRRFEYEIIHKLTADGYTCVRSAGSKSPVDIVAINEEEVLLVQAKTGSTGLTASERKTFESLLCPPCVRKLLYWKKPSGEIVITEL